jgi:spore maturation protein CgeB
VSTLHFAIDPQIYKPYNTPKNIDILFSGGAGSRGRENMIRKMILNPAKHSELRFAVSGNWKIKLSSDIIQFGYLPFRQWLRLNCSSKINLNIIREVRSSIFGTSTYRLFELCGLGCTVITNKQEGIEKWYIPNKEILVLNDEDPLKLYNYFISDKERLKKIGKAAREKTLRKHTCMHRAKELINYVKSLN